MNTSEFKIFTQLVETLLQQKDLDSLLDELLKQLTHILNAERATFYFYHEEVKELWSYIAKGLEIREVRIPLGKGVAGKTAQQKKIINIKDTSTCAYFYSSIDKKTGFHTKTILSAPLINRDKKLLGVIQMINKTNGTFTVENEMFLKSISYFIVIALENMFLQQEQETLLRSTLYALASAIDAKDPVTAGHSHRVAYYSVKIGKQLHLSDAEIKTLEYAAYLHDVGKIGVPEHILQKKDRLTSEEYTEIKKHPVFTQKILKNIIFPETLKDIPEIASSHHEFLDGSGYPQGLKEKAIPLFARIITIADIYDALSSFDRPYKRHLQNAKALTILKEETTKGHLDTQLVNLFINKKLYKFERRHYRRLDINLSLKYQIISQRKLVRAKFAENTKSTASDLNTNRPFAQVTQDISEGGLLFLSKQYFSVGTFLDLEIAVCGQKLENIGKIVRIENLIGTNNYKVGVAFVNMSPDAKIKLQKILEQIASLKSKKNRI